MLRISVVVAGLALLADVGAARANPPNMLGVQTETVCFSVLKPNDPVPITVTGTRFHRVAQPVTAADSVVFLLHGAASTRALFDYQELTRIDDSGSLARSLAKAGRVVITVDRPGYGESPYRRAPGAGRSLSTLDQVEMMHQMVQQIRAGSYSVTDAACPSGSAAGVGVNKLILSAHSIGAGMAEAYVGLHQDVDGLVAITYSSQGPPAILRSILVNKVLPALAAGQDYVQIADPGDECVAATLFMPGMDLAVARDFCGVNGGTSRLELTPIGELLSGPLLSQSINQHFAAIDPALKVLIAYADHDAFVPGPNHGPGDVDQITPDLAKWQASCPCLVSSFTQESSGHVGVLHRTHPTLSGAIVDWLRDNGF